jgi:UDP-N-acetyl-D-glucosamine dehydrogenase
VLESTTYPGTTEELLIPLLEQGSGMRAGEDFHVGYSPERIDPGNTRYTFVNTHKVVSGIDPASLDRVADFYGQLVDQVVPVSSTRVAELTKLLENTFRHVNIALVNELAVFSRALGVSMWEALDAAGTKPFGFMRFNPGPGVGGHCLPVDPSYLSWQVKRETGRNFRFVELANDINDHMPDYVVSRVIEALNSRGRAVKGSRVMLVGVAYKKNTADVRESPAIRLVRLLNDLGADVRYADPHVVAFPGAQRVDLTAEEVDEADATVIVTDHDGVDYDLMIAAPGVVLDTRNRLNGKRELL